MTGPDAQGEKSVPSIFAQLILASTKKQDSSLRTTIVQHNLILGVQVGAPMADFHSSLEVADFKDGLVIVVVDNQGLLNAVQKVVGSADWDVLEGPVDDCGASLGDSSILNERIDTLWSRVGMDFGVDRPRNEV